MPPQSPNEPRRTLWLVRQLEQLRRKPTRVLEAAENEAQRARNLLVERHKAQRSLPADQLSVTLWQLRGSKPRAELREKHGPLPLSLNA